MKNVPLETSYSQKELWVSTQASRLSSFSNLFTVVLAPGCGKLDLQGLYSCTAGLLLFVIAHLVSCCRRN